MTDPTLARYVIEAPADRAFTVTLTPIPPSDPQEPLPSNSTATEGEGL